MNSSSSKSRRLFPKNLQFLHIAIATSPISTPAWLDISHPRSGRSLRLLSLHRSSSRSTVYVWAIAFTAIQDDAISFPTQRGWGTSPPWLGRSLHRRHDAGRALEATHWEHEAILENVEWTAASGERHEDCQTWQRQQQPEIVNNAVTKEDLDWRWLLGRAPDSVSGDGPDICPYSGVRNTEPALLRTGT